MRTVQAGSCLDSEQIDALFISVGGWGGGILGRRPKKCTWVSGTFFCTLAFMSEFMMCCMDALPGLNTH